MKISDDGVPVSAFEARSLTILLLSKVQSPQSSPPCPGPEKRHGGAGGSRWSGKKEGLGE